MYLPYLGRFAGLRASVAEGTAPSTEFRFPASRSTAVIQVALVFLSDF